MTTQYRGLARSTHTAIFFASLMIAFTLLNVVDGAFARTTMPVQVVDNLQEVVVEG